MAVTVAALSMMASALMFILPMARSLPWVIMMRLTVGLYPTLVILSR